MIDLGVLMFVRVKETIVDFFGGAVSAFARSGKGASLLLAAFVLSGCDEDTLRKPSSPSNLISGIEEQLKGVIGQEFGSKLETQVGIMPFPPDITAEAVSASRSIVTSNGDIYTVQLDNGIPWQAGLHDANYPEKLMGEWESHRGSVAAHQDVYLSVAPLKMDRSFWADGYDGAAPPTWVKESREVSSQMRTSYTNYCLKAVEYFNPKYVNIGVEAGELAEKDPELWEQMESLYFHVKRAIKNRFPDLPVGMSFTLPVLMAEGNLERCGEVIEGSDFVGISFYPYLDDFYRATSGVELASPPNQWREPLDWLKEKVSKPIAICETGYSSEPIVVGAWNLDMQGSSSLQEDYVRDLARIAERDGYLFTVFFLSVDYDRLAEKMPDAANILALWQHTGFFDQNYESKPAWNAYREAWLGVSESDLEKEVSSPNVSLISKLISTSGSHEVSDIDGPDGSSGLKWKYEYKLGFEYLLLDVSSFDIGEAGELAVYTKSDRKSVLLVQLEEKSGETFFATISPDADWKLTTLTKSSFSPDPAKRKDGVLDWGSIQSIMLADGAVKDSGASGWREVQVAVSNF